MYQQTLTFNMLRTRHCFTSTAHYYIRSARNKNSSSSMKNIRRLKFRWRPTRHDQSRRLWSILLNSSVFFLPVTMVRWSPFWVGRWETALHGPILKRGNISNRVIPHLGHEIRCRFAQNNKQKCFQTEKNKNLDCK